MPHTQRCTVREKPDLGGVHSAQAGSIALDTLNLQRGKNYELKVFHAERQCCESNFRVETSILIGDVDVCPNQCNAPAGQGACNVNTGTCKCCPGYGGVDCGTAGAYANNTAGRGEAETDSFIQASTRPCPTHRCIAPNCLSSA